MNSARASSPLSWRWLFGWDRFRRKAPPLTCRRFCKKTPRRSPTLARRTVGEVLRTLADSGVPGVPEFLTRWQAREVYRRDSDGLFVYVADDDADPLVLLDVASGAEIGTAGSREVTHLRPNGGVRRVIGGALVQFQLAGRGAGGPVGGPERHRR